MPLVLGSPLHYAVAFAAAYAITFLLTPLAQRVAVRLDIFDHPAQGDHKSHDSPIPYLGGLAILGAFGVNAYFAFIGVNELLAILVAATALSIVGFVDDHRTLSPLIKLLAQVAAAAGVFAYGTRTQLFPGFWPLDLAITVFWIVAITNAFNLLDNMDGLSAGVAAIAAGFFWLIAGSQGQYLVGTLAAVLCAACLAFLHYNFPPARIFMGDAGSLFLGFILAVIGIRLRFPANVNTITWGVPVLVLGYPIFDTTLVIVSRITHGRSWYQGGKDHSSHRLVRMGVPKQQAVSALYLVAALCGFLALVLSSSDWLQALAVLGIVGALATVGGIVLYRVDVYDARRRRGRRHVRTVAQPRPEVSIESRPGVGGRSDVRRRARERRRALRERVEARRDGREMPPAADAG